MLSDSPLVELISGVRRYLSDYSPRGILSPWPRSSASPRQTLLQSPQITPRRSTGSRARLVLMSAVISDHAQPDSSATGSDPSQFRPTSPSVNNSQSFSPQMEQVAQSRPARGSTPGDATDRLAVGTAQTTAVDDASTPRPSQKSRGATQEVNKRSVDYLLRSGVAGGLAGCAVSFASAGTQRIGMRTGRDGLICVT